MNEYEKGKMLAAFFGLRPIKRKLSSCPIAYDTAWGLKSPTGLYESVKRIMDESNDRTDLASLLQLANDMVDCQCKFKSKNEVRK